MKLKFGKFKGQEFSSTPQWYQNWLQNQDWFTMPVDSAVRNSNNDAYALVENRMIHTDDLALEDATEMQERHQRCFPNCRWEILPMSKVRGMDKAEGILERHSRIYAKYA